MNKKFFIFLIALPLVPGCGYNRGPVTPCAVPAEPIQPIQEAPYTEEPYYVDNQDQSQYCPMQETEAIGQEQTTYQPEFYQDRTATETLDQAPVYDQDYQDYQDYYDNYDDEEDYDYEDQDNQEDNQYDDYEDVMPEDGTESLEDMPEDDIDTESEAEEYEEAPAFKEVLFDYNGKTLKKEQETELSRNLGKIRDLASRGYKIVVEGHACHAAGTDAYNLKISRWRAESVVDYLTKNGVDKDRIQVLAHGNKMPIVEGGKEEQAMNRRAEIYAYREA